MTAPMSTPEPDQSDRENLIKVPITADLLHGVVELEQTERGVRPHRLPGWARAQTADPQLAMVEAQTSGVRLVFRTTADVVELEVLPTKVVYPGAPPRPGVRYHLVVDGELRAETEAAAGNVLSVDLATGSSRLEPGPSHTLRFDDLGPAPKTVEIWLPYGEVSELIELRSDAPIVPVTDDRRRWVHHGSSISHGSNADGPTTIWPVVAARGGDVNLTNLGLGGGALLDPFIARTVRDLPADLISIKLGINLTNADLIRMRAFTPAVHGYLDTIRDAHPDTPLLLISPIYCPIHEDTPGPGAPQFREDGTIAFVATGDPAEVAQGKLTLNTIRDELGRIVQQRGAADPQLHYLDGRRLYGPDDHDELPLPDNLHPDPATHRRIGERFTEIVFGAGGPFAG
ncbi:GDSL-type esterase/lipase family protein [Microlunatus elymi]|nr:GDSL-type esterase/lipase family protein [Microlunatus elymi]